MEDNNEWLETVNQRFQESLADFNFSLCLDIIADVKKEGFADQARVMERELQIIRSGGEL